MNYRTLPEHRPKKRRRPISTRDMLAIKRTWLTFRRKDRMAFPETTDPETFRRFIRRKDIQAQIAKLGAKINKWAGLRDNLIRLKDRRRRVIRTPFVAFEAKSNLEAEFYNAMIWNTLLEQTDCGLIRPLRKLY